MLVYQGVKSSFMEDVDLGKIANKIREKYIEVIHRRPPAQEFNSWKTSMQYMRGVLSDNDIPNNVGIAIEYNIPPTGCRIDFLISGYSSDGSHEAVIIELKQWEKCDEVDNVDGIYKVNTYTGHGYRDVNHPSYQAITYANLIRDYNANVEDKLINVRPCAYLHNYYFSENDPLLNDKCKEYIKEAPIFSAEDVIKLRNFIKKYINSIGHESFKHNIEESLQKIEQCFSDKVIKYVKTNKIKPYALHEPLIIKDENIRKYEKYCHDGLGLELKYKNYQYDNDNKIFKTAPLKVIYKRGKAVLIAYDQKENDYKEFVLENIISVKQKPQKQVKGAPASVLFKLKGRLAKSYMLKKGEILLETGEDFIIISNKNEDRELLIRRLLRYYDKCEILYPKSCRKRLIELVNEMEKLYA